MPVARARRARPGRGRAGLGGDPAPARGRRLRRRARPSPGCVYFETRGVERLYGGLEPALKRALAAVGPAGTRARAPPSGGSRRSPRRTSPARARRSSSPTSARGEFLAPLPLTLLPLEPARQRGAGGARGDADRTACRAAGWRRRRTSGAGRPARLEPGERRADGGSADGRPPAELAETLEFPEAVGNELTLRRALAVLARPAARPTGARRAGRRASSRSRRGSSAAARGGAR